MFGSRRVSAIEGTMKISFVLCRSLYTFPRVYCIYMFVIQIRNERFRTLLKIYFFFSLLENAVSSDCTDN